MSLTRMEMIYDSFRLRRYYANVDVCVDDKINENRLWVSTWAWDNLRGHRRGRIHNRIRKHVRLCMPVFLKSCSKEYCRGKTGAERKTST